MRRTLTWPLGSLLTLAVTLLPASAVAQNSQPAPAAASSQTPRPMTFDDVLNVKNVSDAQISPDGRRVAYVVSAVDMKENGFNSDIWLVDAQGGEPMRLTTSKKSDATPRWSPDGRWIAFLSGRNEKNQIFLISPNGGEADQLTEAKTAVSSFQWSPDGKRIAFVATQALTPEEEQKQKDKDDAQVVDQNFKFSRIWVIDVTTKQMKELVAREWNASDPQWSPDGRSIAYTTVPTPKADDGSLSDVWVVDVESGNQRRLLENAGPDNQPRWSPDGRSIALITRASAKPATLGQSSLAIIPAEGGTPRIVTTSFLYQPGGATWSTDGSTLYFSSSVRTTSQLFSVPAAGGTPKQLTDVRGTIGGPTFSRDRTTIAFTQGDVQHPSEVYVGRLGDAVTAQRRSMHNDDIAKLALGTSEVVRWKGRDGMEIEGVLIYPVGYEKGKRYPVHVNIHGGPSGVWTESFPGNWGNPAHVWAGKGWAVFLPNIRGSSGYGERFLLSNVKDWGGGDFRDIHSGIDHLAQRGIADTAKLAQTGWSYGGYMTAWTITQTNRFKGAMVGAGLTNMYSMYSTNDLQRVLEGYFGDEPWNDVKQYERASAMTYIKRAKTPTLIQHGAQDLRVPVGQAQELYMGLRKNGVPVELVFYPREGHGLGEPRHQLDKMKREYAWMAKYVLGESVPAAKTVP